jgi:phosphoglycerate dehydrogenase-like enzyme
VESIVYLGPESSSIAVKKILGAQYRVVVSPPVPGEFWPLFRECTAFLDASMKIPITADEIARANNLRLIATATTGASHIDQEALQQRNIPLLTLKGEKELLANLTPAAELSWLLLMACARHLRSAIHHVEQGQWERTLFPGTMLKGKVLGIIGFGRLGSWMAKYAQAFGMEIRANDPYVTEFPPGVHRVELEELLSTSDFITVHIHLSPETRDLLNAEKIRQIKIGAVLINTSRAELIDENAVVEALEAGRLASAGVDVLLDEPNIFNDPLWQYAQHHQNVIITPHIGGFSPEAVDLVVAFTARRILSLLGNQP